MSQNDSEYSTVYQKVEKLLRGWLTETGGQRVDTYYNAIHLTGEVVHWLSIGGQQESVRLPSEISFAMDDLRPAQADPVRGAWLWSHLWMEASDGVLHQECDWMREPVIGSDPVGDGDAAFERDPEWIPEWMATKAAAYHKEAERRERRRQRDRERRAKKKAEAAQAEGTSGSDGPAGE